MRSRSSQRPPRACKAVLLLALLAAIFLLPRALVVCSGPHCSARIEFAHREHSCCSGSHARAGKPGPQAPGGGSRIARAHGHCVDAPLLLETGPLPRTAGAPDLDPSPVAAVPPPLIAGAAEPAAPLPHPPATGPPRPDRRVALKATTVLLV